MGCAHTYAFILIDHEHIPGGKYCIHLLFCHFCQVKDNVKLASPSLFAADRNSTAHCVHNKFGDCHSQPGPFGFLYTRGIFSAERVKYFLLILLRHTNPCITHQEMRADTGSILPQWFLIYNHLNSAVFRRKFDGIAQQINQYLVQPHTVTTHILRKNFISQDIKPLIFCLHLGLYDIDNAVHYFSQ